MSNDPVKQPGHVSRLRSAQVSRPSLPPNPNRLRLRGSNSSVCRPAAAPPTPKSLPSSKIGSRIFPATEFQSHDNELVPKNI